MKAFQLSTSRFTRAMGIIACIAGVSAMPLPAQAGTVNVAVAANFLGTVHLLAPVFEQAYPDTIQISSGSTGKLYAQIVNGAPFDVFMAADVRRPKKLEQKGYAVKGSRFTYALGKLAFWAPSIKAASPACRQALRHQAIKHLAIANPVTAPYGLAAQQTLQHMGLWQAYEKKVVQGENIAQTYQFVSSGASDGGFIAASELGPRASGCVWNVPKSYHAPLEQQAVLIKHKTGIAAARDWMAFLKSAKAVSLIRQQGYSIP